MYFSTFPKELEASAYMDGVPNAIATRDDFLEGPSKRADLADVLEPILINLLFDN